MSFTEAVPTLSAEAWSIDDSLIIIALHTKRSHIVQKSIRDIKGSYYFLESSLRHAKSTPSMLLRDDADSDIKNFCRPQSQLTHRMIAGDDRLLSRSFKA